MTFDLPCRRMCTGKDIVNFLENPHTLTGQFSQCNHVWILLKNNDKMVMNSSQELDTQNFIPVPSNKCCVTCYLPLHNNCFQLFPLKYVLFISFRIQVSNVKDSSLNQFVFLLLTWFLYKHKSNASVAYILCPTILIKKNISLIGFGLYPVYMIALLDHMILNNNDLWTWRTKDDLHLAKWVCILKFVFLAAAAIVQPLFCL
jgi:hypothetical protein